MRRLRQIEEYKQMISEAFLRLLQKQSMDQIKVSQITAEAGIGRNTFYNHFKKKEDILDYLLQDLVEELQIKIMQKPNPSIRELLIGRFTLIKDNPLLLIFLTQDDIKQLFYRFRSSQAALFNFDQEKESYKMAFFQGGIDYATSKWIISGMKESPEEITDKILSFINR